MSEINVRYKKGGEGSNNLYIYYIKSVGIAVQRKKIWIERSGYDCKHSFVFFSLEMMISNLYFS